MPHYSESSARKLSTADEELRNLFRRVLKAYDHTIIEGYRGRHKQNRLFDEGASKVRYPHGRHNKKPSEAVDAAPYIPELGGIPWPKQPANWDNKELVQEYISRLSYFYHFAGFVQGAAHVLAIPIRWGGDWDRDFFFGDQTFNDLVHFEKIKR